MSDDSVANFLSRTHWQRWVIWGLFIFLVYELRDFFFIAFVTFLLCYIVRAIVTALTKRLSPGHERVWLDRLLTLGTFAVIASVIAGAVLWIGPQIIQQSRALLVRQQFSSPQNALEGLLNRTVGSVLMWQQYGGSQDERYQTALKQYREDGRQGEGYYSQFSALHAHLKSGFQAEYEEGERRRIEQLVRTEKSESDEFDEWFLQVKAPELFEQHRQKYLDDWGIDTQSNQSEDDQTVDESNSSDLTPSTKRNGSLDATIRQRILDDVESDPIVLADLRREWEQAIADSRWREFLHTAEYQQAFEAFYKEQREENPDAIPFTYETYMKLKAAYPKGKDAFAQALPDKSETESHETAVETREDFELAMQRDLAQQWWSQAPMAASIRQHAKEDLPKLIESFGETLKSLLHKLLEVPAQLVTALLLSMFICFDMLHLKKSVASLKETRVKHFYNEIVPGLIVFSRLIGRSFSAQALIAVFNTLLSFLLLWMLGIGNELLLCTFVFLGSFIPVLGVLLSGIPIVLQAILQPDGSLELAIQVIIGILVIHLIEASFLSPKIVGKVLHLHPVAVLVILAIGEHFFGLWGLLLGVPVAVYLMRVVILNEPIPGIYDPKSRLETTTQPA
ncbi:AI-2E family transporter [Thalassoglobus sp. JC818]|uniref:AI-2E family transporter n=1 Tax=Thalassoglobus sp. JC818 TaxID=3232136 RepID=UPI003458AF6F